MKKEYIISAIGGNRPGLVEELTRQIYLSGINVENSSMTLLGGHFSLMIHIIAEEQTIQNVLADRLRSIEAETEISTHIFRAPEKFSGTEEGAKPQYAIRVRGDNRSGILYKTSSFLARRGVNILEMYTSVEKPSQGRSPLFLMYTRIEAPEDLDPNEFLVNLEHLASELHESMTLTRIS